MGGGGGAGEREERYMYMNHKSMLRIFITHNNSAISMHHAYMYM